jgi:hypothetical protein
MSENNSTSFSAQALIIGRSLADPAAAYSGSNLYDGPAQDIAIYTTFVQVN